MTSRLAAAAVASASKGIANDSIALVFPGQGSQYVGMAKDLFREFPTARNMAKEVDEILGINLSKMMEEGPMVRGM